jgi:hypothetical protein
MRFDPMLKAPLSLSLSLSVSLLVLGACGDDDAATAASSGAGGATATSGPTTTSTGSGTGVGTGTATSGPGGAGGASGTGGNAEGGMGGEGGGQEVPEDADYYVSVEGDDENPGTIDAPFATLEAADAVVAPGDLVYVREGIHATPARLEASGADGAPVRWEGYPGESVVLRGPGRESAYEPQILAAGDWLEVRRLIIEDAASYGVLVVGDDVHLDRLTVRESGRVGVLFFETSRGSITSSLVFGSYDKYDSDGSPSHGQDGDGIAFAASDGGLIDRCVSWGNSDDGYDLWMSTNSRVQRSIAFGNGVDRWGDDAFEGNGNGFKLGGPGSMNVSASRNISFDNVSRGFDSNGAANSPVTHCTSARDNWGFTNRDGTNAWTNNVALDASSGGVQENQDVPRSNAWDLGIAVTAAHFVTTTAPPVSPDDTSGPVLAAFEASGFMVPAAGSPLVDAGEDLGDPFNGAAPDLGAREAP